MSNLRRLRRSMAQAGTTPQERPGEAAVEAAGHYPGPGRHNAYRCGDCGSHTVVVHVDAGVTPMFLGCRATPGCKSRAVSLGYPDGPIPSHLLPAEWEWYRPAAGDRVLREPGMRQHVEDGGLVLRPRATGDSGAS